MYILTCSNAVQRQPLSDDVISQGALYRLIMKKNLLLFVPFTPYVNLMFMMG